MEGTAQVYRGDSDDLFRAADRQDPGHCRAICAYRDLSERPTSLGGGGPPPPHRGGGGGGGGGGGAPLTRGEIAQPFASRDLRFFTIFTARTPRFVRKPLRRAVYKNFLLRTELFGAPATSLPHSHFQTQNAFGMDSSAGGGKTKKKIASIAADRWRPFGPQRATLPRPI